MVVLIFYSPTLCSERQYSSYKELSKSYFTVEGSEEKINFVKQWLEVLETIVCVISKENKVKYHASAAIASNLVVGLISLSEQFVT